MDSVYDSVVATMPPRARSVRLTGWPTSTTDQVVPAVAFAVWASGEITPIVDLVFRLQTFPSGGSVFASQGDWELTQ